MTVILIGNATFQASGGRRPGSPLQAGGVEGGLRGYVPAELVQIAHPGSVNR